MIWFFSDTDMFFFSYRDSSWNYDDISDIEMSRACTYYFRFGDNEFVLSLQNGQVFIVWIYALTRKNIYEIIMQNVVTVDLRKHFKNLSKINKNSIGPKQIARYTVPIVRYQLMGSSIQFRDNIHFVGGLKIIN